MLFLTSKKIYTKKIINKMIFIDISVSKFFSFKIMKLLLIKVRNVVNVDINVVANIITKNLFLFKNVNIN